MSLKPYGTRPSIDGSVYGGNRDDDVYIVEAEVGTSFDRTYDYTYSGSSSSFLTASGNNEADSTANIEFIVLSLSGSGEGQSFSFGVLAETLNISASGLSSTEKVANFGIIYDDINASGLSSTKSSSTLSRAIEFVGNGDGVGTGEESLLGFLINVTGSGEGEGIGQGEVGYPVVVSGDGIGKGQYYSSILSNPRKLNSTGFGIGSGSSNATVQTYDDEQQEIRSKSFLVGNKEIPLLVSKSTSVSRDTIVKDFVEQDSELFQDNRSFESGTYSAFLNPDNHSQGKSIEKQMEDVRTILDRTAESNDIEYTDGTAYLAVQSISDVIDVNPNLREVELDVIVLEDV